MQDPSDPTIRQQSIALPCLRVAGTTLENPDQEELIHIIEFCHPGYKYPYNILFRLPALDHREWEAGVHHETARLACCILAGNMWDGWLTTTEADGPRVDTTYGTEDILTGSRYYFHCPADPADTGTQNPYSIVRSFESWCFPRDNIPAYWKALAIPPISASAQQPPLRCAVSGRFLPLEGAHLIPLSHSAWFDRNRMGLLQHTVGSAHTRWINQPSNLLRLTKDIHYLFDNEYLVFVPHEVSTEGSQVPGVTKYTQRNVPGSPTVALTCQVLRPSPANEVGRVYHLRSLEPLQDIQPEYLFANFALKICNLCIFFQDDGVRRYCLELRVDEKDGGLSHAVQVATFPDLQSQRPSRSPTKRRTDSQDSSNKRTHSDQDGDDRDVYSCGRPQRDEETHDRDSCSGITTSVDNSFASFRDDGATASTVDGGSPAPRGRALKRPLPRMPWSRNVEEEGRRAGLRLDLELDGGVETEEGNMPGAVEKDAECDGDFGWRSERIVR